VKWEAPDKFHITMFFIGEIDEEKAAQLANELKNVKNEKIGSISLELGNLNGFPDLRRARVLFTEVKDIENKLTKLSIVLNRIMKGFGYEQGGKFKAHITLGRVRKDSIIKGLTELSLNGNFEIKKLHIMKSVLSREGAVHESIFSTEL
jgi:RNA 2',3'-cyclic 3'-phosphodiesterase